MIILAELVLYLGVSVLLVGMGMWLEKKLTIDVALDDLLKENNTLKEKIREYKAQIDWVNDLDGKRCETRGKRRLSDKILKECPN